MQHATIEAAGSSVAAPALVAVAITLAFIACHYRAERKSWRDFLRWRDSINPGPLKEAVDAPPAPGGHGWTHPSGLYGVGTYPWGVAGAAVSLGSFLRTHARAYALTILWVSLALALRLVLEPKLHGQLAYAFFSAAVLLTALVAGIWETLLALVLGFLAAAWFLVDPPNSFMISGTHGWLGALLYFLIGLGILWFKQSEKSAGRQALASDIANLDRLAELDRERAICATLSHMVENCQEALVSLTKEGRILTWNAAAQKLLGYSAQEAINQPLAFMVPPAEQSKSQQLLSATQHSDPAAPWQIVLNRKDGSQVKTSLAVSAARDARQEIIGVCVAVHPCPPESRGTPARRARKREPVFPQD